MKLDRNITRPRRGKYALIKLRDVKLPFKEVVHPGQSIVSEVPSRSIDFGDKLTDFFVIRLKDKYAVPALRAYARAARRDDAEYAREVDRLAELAKKHPLRQRPT